jgi:hypothetical protein
MTRDNHIHPAGIVGTKVQRERKLPWFFYTIVNVVETRDLQKADIRDDLDPLLLEDVLHHPVEDHHQEEDQDPREDRDLPLHAEQDPQEDQDHLHHVDHLQEDPDHLHVDEIEIKKSFIRFFSY